MTVFYILDHLKPTSTGFNELSSWFLRIGAPFFAKPISDLFNMSIMTSHVPTQWKLSSINPIPKIPKPASPSDYRPISITFVLSRTLERIIVTKYIYPALNNPPPSVAFSDQFAFRPTGSTTSAIITILQTITNLLDTEP